MIRPIYKKNLYEATFRYPLHGIKKMDDDKNLHIIMYPIPKDKDDNKYNLDYLKVLMNVLCLHKG